MDRDAQQQQFSSSDTGVQSDGELTLLRYTGGSPGHNGAVYMEPTVKVGIMIHEGSAE